MQITDNTRAFIESEVVSAFILTNLNDGLLGESFFRNVQDFLSGDTLYIKTVGTVQLQEASENTPLVYSPIETGQITFRITEYIGDAWHVTDDLREDGNQIDSLLAERAAASTRAIQEKFETDFFKTVGDFYLTASDDFAINGQPHLIVSGETNDVLSLDHVLQLRLSFDKANVPAEGRVLFVDPVVEATYNNLVTITSDITPYSVDIVTNGIARGQRFMHRLYGFDIIVSNRLPTGNFNDGTNSVTGGVLNIAMCVADDQTKPVMGAWRRMPKSEGERNKDLARDEHVVRARYGFGLQRRDTLGGIATSATAWK